MASQDEIDRRFDDHPIDSATQTKLDQVRALMKSTVEQLQGIVQVTTHEESMGLRRMEEAHWWYRQALIRPESTGPGS